MVVRWVLTLSPTQFRFARSRWSCEAAVAVLRDDYATAVAGRPAPKLDARQPPPGVACWEAGDGLVPLATGGGGRGAGGHLPESGGLDWATGWLRALAGPDATAAAIGFTTTARE